MQKVPGLLRLFAGTFFLVAASGCDDFPGSAPASTDASSLTAGLPTHEFLIEAIEASRLEVQAAQLAAEKAQSPQVKLFANMMFKAHSRMSDSLTQLAFAQQVELPAGAGKRGSEILTELKGLSGPRFDETYSAEMRKVHKDALSLFDEASRSATDPNIQNFARSQLPILRDQMRVAHSLPGAEQG